MNDLAKAVLSEGLKMKRTLALAMTLLAPLVIVLLSFAMVADNAERYIQMADDESWKNFIQNSFVYWNLLMVPLFITLETALVNNIEHQHRNWKLLYTQPIPRWTIYAAKGFISLGLIALSFSVMTALILLAGFILQALFPGLGLDRPVPWETVARYCAGSFLASWLILSIHLWISSRWKSIVVALGSGIAATVGATFLINSEYVQYYPWTLPGLLVVEIPTRFGDGGIMLLGAIGGVLVFLLATWDITRQDVV